jgi:hypothetical protein
MRAHARPQAPIIPTAATNANVAAGPKRQTAAALRDAAAAMPTPSAADVVMKARSRRRRKFGGDV